MCAQIIPVFPKIKAKHVSDELTRETMSSIPPFNYVIALKDYGDALILRKRLVLS